MSGLKFDWSNALGCRRPNKSLRMRMMRGQGLRERMGKEDENDLQILHEKDEGEKEAVGARMGNVGVRGLEPGSDLVRLQSAVSIERD